MHLDNDIVAFGITIAVILITGISALRRSIAPLPVKLQLEELSPEGLNPLQSQFLAQRDADLEPLYYRPVGTYRAANYGHNLMRSYLRPGDPARCVVTVVEHRAKTGGGNHVSQTWQYEFITRFADGRSLSTNNMRLRSLLDSPPEFVKQAHPSLRDAAEIKKRHDARAATMGVPVPPAMDLRSIFAEVESGHKRLSEYRAKNGNYKIAATGDVYELTDKVYWRGIRNFLNPFVHRFSVLEFVAALCAAAALPLLGLREFVPGMVAAAARNGYSPGLAFYVSTALCYLLAGAVIGYALVKHTFVWVFMLCFVAVHAAFGWSVGVGGFGLLASWAGHSVAQMKQHRRIFLLPKLEGNNPSAVAQRPPNPDLLTRSAALPWDRR
jgi:hypothetical protein